MASNSQQVFAYLQSQGLSAGAAAGVVGNLIVESGVNPVVRPGDGGTSHGIAQWHLTRWDSLVAWAKGLGKDPNSLEAQEAYLVHEAQGMGPLWGQLKKTTDPSAAAALWQRLFERPANLDPTARAAAARKVLATGGNVPGVTSAGQGGGAVDPSAGGAGTGGGGGFVAQPTALGINTEGIMDGVKKIAFMGLAGAFGLALVGFGVATAAKKGGGA